MERILILMQAANWAEATEALTSARENALHRNALSYALVLPEAPTSPEECNMAAFGALRYLVSPEMTFAAMETLWHGERYALLAHPAMRFERDWEKKLLRALNDCPVENAQAVLTGYLPAQDDPIGAVCPVAAERIDPDDTLCFAHGMPLTLAAHPMPGAFLHPDFFFARGLHPGDGAGERYSVPARDGAGLAVLHAESARHHPDARFTRAACADRTAGGWLGAAEGRIRR